MHNDRLYNGNSEVWKSVKSSDVGVTVQES